MAWAVGNGLLLHLGANGDRHFLIAEKPAHRPYKYVEPFWPSDMDRNPSYLEEFVVRAERSFAQNNSVLLEFWREQAEPA